MLITRAEVSDAVEILALQKAAFQIEAELYPQAQIAPLLQSLDQLMGDLVTHTYLKAIDEEKIVGAVRGIIKDGTAHIGRLMVLPNRQGQGIGTQLVTEIERRLANVARYELFTGYRSSNNIRLYQKLGYREFRQQEIGDGLKLVFMEKLIDEARR